MKHALPRLASVALPAGVILSLGLAHAQSSAQLTTPPMIPGRTPVVVTPTTGTAGALATCLPAIQDQSGAGCIQASSVPTLGDLLPLSSYFHVTPFGNVGLGTTSPLPGYPGNWRGLDLNNVNAGGSGVAYVRGDVDARLVLQARNNSADRRQFMLQNHADRLAFSWLFDNIFNAIEPMSITSAGNIGIGTTNPAAKLDVNGSARITGQTTLATTEIVSSNDLRFGAAGENTDNIFFERWTYAADQSVLELVLGDDPTGGAGNDAFVISTRSLDGSTGQGMYQFNSNGDALKPGGGSWAALSDRRAKHDIQPLAGALDKVLSLEGKTYYYNDPKTAGAIEGLCTGFIAQEVEQIFPEWVSELADGTKTLNIRGFEALTVEALRDLRTEKDAAVAELESENAELRQRVEALESVQVEVASLKAALATLIENR